MKWALPSGPPTRIAWCACTRGWSRSTISRPIWGRRWLCSDDRELPIGQADLVKPDGKGSGGEVGVSLESDVHSTVPVRGMRHGDVHHATIAVQSHRGKDGLPRAIALEFPDQMVPGFWR